MLDQYKVEENKKMCLQRNRLPSGMEACTKKQEVQNTEVERRLLGKNIRLVLKE